jgi:hypothetical protein
MNKPNGTLTLVCLTAVFTLSFAGPNAKAANPAPTASDTSQELVPTEVLIIEQATARSKKGGGSSSIGTDAYDEKTHSAWFYGNRPIITCFNHVESFGAPAERAANALKTAVTRWREYFAAKKIAKADHPLAPNVNFQLNGRCKGDEDLVIFFGTGPIFGNQADLKAVQKLNFPVAYVNKTHMYRDMKWSKGYIRLVGSGYYGAEKAAKFPDWSVKDSVESILVHEIGHVLGFSHTPETVMRSELVDQAFSKESSAKGLAIDGRRELITCVDCSTEYKLIASPTSKEFFEVLGLNNQKPVKLNAGPEGFSLTDGAKTVRVQESSRAELENLKTLASNFPEAATTVSRTYSIYGSVSPAPEKKIPVVIEYNSTAGAIVLRSLEKGEILEVARAEF